ncbi:hypothetical protein AX16_004508 [Volvariella volvacea WC 439]|nr:hypothetical protein AX16_004508 [Volvariella volvacea WC 439]
MTDSISVSSHAETTVQKSKYPPLPVARKIYIRIVAGGTVLLILAIFSIFAIFWGALWKIPARPLPGLVVNYDDGQIGDAVVQALEGLSDSRISWHIASPEDYPGGAERLASEVLNHKSWIAVAVNENASRALQASLINPDPSYNGSHAITVFGVEARQENAFRALIRPTVQMHLGIISTQFALNLARVAIENSAINTTNILAVSPQTLIQPVSYTLQNLRPFDVPVASGSTFVGLIFLLILSFFLVMISNAAREVSGLQFTLSTRGLIILRLATPFIGYFFLSLFYSLLNLAFQLPLDRWFGRGGFMIFWMLNWIAMLSVGLAIESMFTLLTIRFVPFFLLLWVISNVSVIAQPIEVMPVVFRYGRAAPFYCISRAVRSIVFGTKNTLGQDFGILIAWVAISCITLPLFQILVRRKGWNQTPSVPPVGQQQVEPRPLEKQDSWSGEVENRDSSEAQGRRSMDGLRE